MSKLNARQAAFAVEYAKDKNATAAAKRAGYSAKTAYMQGSRLLKKDEVRKAVESHQKQVERRVRYTIEDHLRNVLEDYERLREPDDDGNPRDAAAAARFADQAAKILGAYERDNRQRGDIRLDISWGGSDDDSDARDDTV